MFLFNCVWHVTCETACHVPHYINCGKFHSLDVNGILPLQIENFTLIPRTQG